MEMTQLLTNKCTEMPHSLLLVFLQILPYQMKERATGTESMDTEESSGEVFVDDDNHSTEFSRTT